MFPEHSGSRRSSGSEFQTVQQQKTPVGRRCWADDVALSLSPSGMSSGKVSWGYSHYSQSYRCDFGEFKANFWLSFERL